MKTIKLNPTLSIKALESKARRNAVIAASKASSSSRSQNDDPKSKRPQRKQPPLIEREINSIYRTLKLKTSGNRVITLERPGRYSTCKATISIYSTSAQRVPLVMYAFYSDILHPNKLGSIAIYGDNPEATQKRVLTYGALFGHMVKRVTIENGRRPFVDVTLVA